MTTRTATAVIIRAVLLSNEGVKSEAHYGPFLPHVGSATTTFIDKLERELEASGRYQHWDISVEKVFIADGESDCELRPTTR
ncbi:hypothetical protein C7474_1473 [Microbacterium telephonicum]|uniref:Uncharacterized protein n=1 Tax=Microbacterium telephonicum TaxID=1714841 RepID=A0A498C8T0_9MICO|nr:hypothetical protein C7474_1473 [Microbacterium telephonicum]